MSNDQSERSAQTQTPFQRAWVDGARGAAAELLQEGELLQELAAMDSPMSRALPWGEATTQFQRMQKIFAELAAMDISDDIRRAHAQSLIDTWGLQESDALDGEFWDALEYDPLDAMMALCVARTAQTRANKALAATPVQANS